MRAKLFDDHAVGVLRNGSARLGPHDQSNCDRASRATRHQLPPRSTFNSPAKLHSASARKPLAVWECTSSWYGDDFDGQPTANGETYDMYAATAAHPTLPLGSIVRVVNTAQPPQPDRSHQ